MKNNAFRLLVAACLLLITNAQLLAQAKTDSIKQNIKQALSDRIANKVYAGAVVAFLDNGKEEYLTYGFANSVDKKPITKKSVFEIGSISKTFTSLLLANLVEKGIVKLDDPAQKFLPDSVKLPTFNGQPIKLIDLAKHTSGLPSMPDNFNPKNPENPFADYDPKNLYAFLKTYKLTRAVGTFEYSNVGVGLLGHILTLITKKSYEELLQEVICKPLQMTETSIMNKSPYLTDGHSGMKPIPHWDLNIFEGAGAIRSNAADVMRYVKTQLGLLPSGLKQAMALTQQPHRKVGEGMQIGLGWLILSGDTDEVFWHNGATGGYLAYTGFSRKTNKAIVILVNTNAEPSPDDLGMHFFNPSEVIRPAK